MKVLVINCGSSSLKYQLIDMENESVLAKGICERIGAEGSILTHKPTGKDKFVTEQPMEDHSVAVKLVMEALQDPEHGVIASADEIQQSDTVCCMRVRYIVMLHWLQRM